MLEVRTGGILPPEPDPRVSRPARTRSETRLKKKIYPYPNRGFRVSPEPKPKIVRKSDENRRFHLKFLPKCRQFSTRTEPRVYRLTRTRSETRILKNFPPDTTRPAGRVLPGTRTRSHLYPIVMNFF